jgi:hypothetical protein
MMDSDIRGQQEELRVVGCCQKYYRNTGLAAAAAVKGVGLAELSVDHSVG